MSHRTPFTICLGLVLIAPQLAGQTPAGFKRTVIQQSALSIRGREAVTAIVDFEAGSTVGRHTHPGEEIGYILDGTLVFEIAGKPAMTLSAGQTFFIPAGTVHNATNRTSAKAKVLANYVVETGKPLATAV